MTINMNSRKSFLNFFFSRSFSTKQSSKKVSHKKAIENFFLQYQHLASVKQHIPPKYLTYKRKGIEHLYLICPNIAKIIAAHVKTGVEHNKNQVIAETNAGLGLISMELLESGVKPVRLYESCSDFKGELMDFGNEYPGQVELFIKDIFHLYRFAYVDKQDRGNRVELLLKNVPKRNWTDEPVMTIVGAMPTLSFIRYLIKCVCLQKDIVQFGRFQIFAIMKPRHYAILNATPEDNLNAYQYWTVLFNTLFNYELLETFPRKFFVPWESPLPKTITNRYPYNLEPDQMYLVKLNFKKELPLSTEHLPLLYFGRNLYGRGSNKIIPTIEKWIPGCGLNIILPKLRHRNYFEDIHIFTEFRELTPPQILSIFKEIINYPSYSGSSFTAMIENDLLKSETIETSMAESTPTEKHFEEEIEQNLEIK